MTWRSRSPIPYQSTWDGLLHTAVIDRMIDQNRFSLSLKTLTPSFNFDAYLPAFHLDLGMGSQATGATVLDELWAGPIVLIGIAVVGTVMLLRTASMGFDAVPSVAAACLTGLVMTTRKSTNPLLSILPASVVMSMLPLVVLTLFDKNPRRGLLRGATISLLLCAMHGLMGLCVIDFYEEKYRRQTEYFLTALGL